MRRKLKCNNFQEQFMNFKLLFSFLIVAVSSFGRSIGYAMSNERGVVGVLPAPQLAAQSRKIGFDSELRMKTLLEDIYTELKGQYNTETKKMSRGIYMEVSDAALSDSNTAVITMKLKLSQPGVMGNAVAIGAEELWVTKAMRIFRNDCRKPVSTPKYGAHKLDQDYLNLRKQHIDDLADWNKEEEGLEIRQALLEQFGETLYHGDTALTCVPNWNVNMFICGLPLRGGHPVYSSNPATYSARIVNSIIASGNGSFTPIVNQTLNQPNLSNLSNMAMAKRINRLSIPGIPGGKGFILTISEIQATYLGDPAWSARNLGALYIAFNQLHEEVQNWKGVLGAYKDMVIVVDSRAPTVLPAGSCAPYSLTSGYMWHGDTDLRNRNHRHVRDVCFLHGQGAVVSWYPEKIHFEEQDDDYRKIHGICTALVRGIQTPLFDQQIPGIGTQEQFSSMAVLCSMPDYV